MPLQHVIDDDDEVQVVFSRPSNGTQQRVGNTGSQKRARPVSTSTAARQAGGPSAPVVVDLTDAPDSPGDDDIVIVAEVKRARPLHQSNLQRHRLRPNSTGAASTQHMQRLQQPQGINQHRSPAAQAPQLQAPPQQQQQLQPQQQQPQLPAVTWHPAIPPPSPEREKEKGYKCNICFERCEDLSSTTCGHIFCTDCITAAVKTQKKCPHCRKNLTMKQIHKIYLPS